MAARVTFSVTGHLADWDESSASLLEFAEALGLKPPFSCRSGICNTCMRKVEGEVRMSRATHPHPLQLVQLITGRWADEADTATFAQRLAA